MTRGRVTSNCLPSCRFTGPEGAIGICQLLNPQSCSAWFIANSPFRQVSFALDFWSNMIISELLQDLRLFIKKEHNHCSDDCGNLFSVSCEQFIRYLEFLEVIYYRYKAAETDSTKLFKDSVEQSKRVVNGPVPDDLGKLIENS